jgi:hypothetical protein
MFKTILLLPLILLSCSSLSYSFYGLQLEQGARGTLLAEKQEDDLDLEETCYPNKKCVVLKKEEFFKLVRDYAETKEKLKSCEKR